jgi:hypothetical protein
MYSYTQADRQQLFVSYKKGYILILRKGSTVHGRARHTHAHR